MSRGRGQVAPERRRARANSSKPTYIHDSQAVCGWPGFGNGVQRQAAAEQQRVADPHALVAALGDADRRRARARPAASRSSRWPDGRVDADDGLARGRSPRRCARPARRSRARRTWRPARGPPRCAARAASRAAGCPAGRRRRCRSSASRAARCQACATVLADPDPRAGRHPLGVAATRRRSSRTLQGFCAPAARRSLDLGDGCLLARPAGHARRPCCWPGTSTRSPRRATCPGRVDGGAVHGLGASDMKGGLAVAIELVLAGVPVSRRCSSRARSCRSPTRR